MKKKLNKIKGKFNKEWFFYFLGVLLVIIIGIIIVFLMYYFNFQPPLCQIFESDWFCFPF